MIENTGSAHVRVTKVARDLMPGSKMQNKHGLARVFLAAFVSLGTSTQFVNAADSTSQPRLAPDSPPVVYPQEAYDAKQQGSVKLGFDITEDGIPLNVKVLEATGSESLRNEAIAIVRFSHYEPVVINGRKQPATGLTRTIDFNLATALLGPKRISTPKPSWPSNNTSLGGFCDVGFVVEADGSVSKAEVYDSGPTQGFDEASLDAVRRWKFQPAMRDGKPIAVPQFYRLTFRGPDAPPNYMGPGQWVTLRYTLKKDGTPTDVEVVAQSDPSVFAGKAKRQLLHTHLKPVIEDGVPVDKPGLIFTISGPAK